MHDIDLTAQWLIQGATDRLRARATFGTTQVLKLAHFAELYGANVELNGQGGLFGLVHAHLSCCIDNTDYYEYFFPTGDGNHKQGLDWGLLNAPLIEDGHLAPPNSPGWGAEWVKRRFNHGLWLFFLILDLQRVDNGLKAVAILGDVIGNGIECVFAGDGVVERNK